MGHLNILLADHHEITREGYMAVLERSLAEVQFGHARNFLETRSAFYEVPWNLVIMEIAMPDGDGLDLLSSIRQQKEHHSPPVLISSSQDEGKYGVRSIQNGASGFVSKAAGVEDFLKSVYAVLDGRNYLSQTLAQKLVNHVRPNTHLVSHDILSVREYDVMLKLADGMAIKEVAKEMELSSKTVSTYRSRLMQKLSLKSLADIVRYCVDHELMKD